jgi:hypothetical protein
MLYVLTRKQLEDIIRIVKYESLAVTLQPQHYIPKEAWIFNATVVDRNVFYVISCGERGYVNNIKGFIVRG